MSEIILKNITKRWGDFVGVENMNLTIPDKEFLVLLGPSGCGKTTTMRMIAGLEDATSGDILGASVGASVVIVLVGGSVASPLAGLSLISFGAFIGGVISTLVVYRVATSGMGTSVTTMLLAGIAIGAIAGAFNSLLSYFSDNQMLRQISVWQMGNLGGANWLKVSIMLAVAAILAAVLPTQAKSLNALLLGESEARHLGVDVQRIKRKLIFLTALGVGVSVALAGLIGFVGLIIPHMVRLLIGPDHRWLLPATALAGASLLMIADSIARVVVLPAELPTGILTALLGAPFFIGLLIRQRGEF